MTRRSNQSYRFKLTIFREHADNVRGVRRVGAFNGPVIIDDEGHPQLVGVECDTELDYAMLVLLGAMPPDRVRRADVPRAR